MNGSPRFFDGKRKECGRCKEIKPISSYYKNSSKKIGYQSHCKSCHLSANKDWKNKNKQQFNETRNKKRLKRKQEMIDKMGGCCQDCGGKFPPSVYDFHHEGEKGYKSEYAINQLSKKTMYREMEKCVLLCANCHRIRHWK